jgi:hypothetical protein
MLSALYPSCELLAILFPTSGGRLNIITLYQPSTRSTAFYSELHDLLDEIDGLPGRSIICRGFDSPSSLSSRVLDQHLIDILAGHNMEQRVSELTHRHGGPIDLLITPVSLSVIKSTPSVQDLGYPITLLFTLCSMLASPDLLQQSFTIINSKTSTQLSSRIGYKQAVFGCAQR